jgi:F-type H+-transporting ATPase subunit b
MEHLLQPEFGLMIWTVITFLVMVVILKRIAWKPLLKAIDEREDKINRDLKSIQDSRAEMERLKKDYEHRMIEIQDRMQAMLAEAERQGNVSRERIVKAAEEEAHGIAEKTRKQLEGEKDRLVAELRQEIGSLAVEVAEKLMRQTVDKKIQDRVFEDFLKTGMPEGKN